MQLREATPQDVPSVVALLAQDQLGHHREATSDPLPDDYWEAFEAIDADANNLLVVAEDQGVIVGTLQLTFIPYLTFRGSWRAQIEAVRVESSRRGQGVGRRLMEWAIDQTRGRDCHLVQLTTNKSRHDAHRFYESLGFEPSHEGMKLYLEGDVTDHRTPLPAGGKTVTIGGYGSWGDPVRGRLSRSGLRQVRPAAC